MTWVVSAVFSIDWFAFGVFVLGGLDCAGASKEGMVGCAGIIKDSGVRWPRWTVWDIRDFEGLFVFECGIARMCRSGGKGPDCDESDRFGFTRVFVNVLCASPGYPCRELRDERLFFPACPCL